MRYFREIDPHDIHGENFPALWKFDEEKNIMYIRLFGDKDWFQVTSGKPAHGIRLYNYLFGKDEIDSAREHIYEETVFEEITEEEAFLELL